jgi:hypothetical protein
MRAAATFVTAPFDTPVESHPFSFSSPLQELMMKALISAFALLSFVAASTVPSVAQADTKTPTHHTTTKHTTHKASTHKASAKKSTKKHVAKAKKTHKTASKKKPMANTAKG